MPLAIDKRFNQIDTVLHSCLNWQESVAIAWYGDIDCGKRATVSDVAATAFQKLTFLQDALIYFLRGEPCQFDDAGANDAAFTFNEIDVLPLLNDDDQYFSALALAKLFRARMFTRCGHRHGLSWGSRFSYPRCPTTYGYLARFRRRRLADARRACFISPPANSRTPAAELAVRLLKSARDFVSFYDEALTDDQRGVLRHAVLGHPYDAAALLDVWTIGCGGVYNLPMDTLWMRTADCVYTKSCVGYDDFVALTQAQARSNTDGGDSHTSQRNAFQLANDKVALLKAAESESEWREVARNWWCSGFVRGVYSWQSAVKINRNIVADVQAVVDRIRNDDLYERVNEASAVRDLLYEKVDGGSAVQELFIPMTREACEGATPREIASRVGISNINMFAVYSFLFLVATTQKAPKLQDCWHR